MISPHDRKLLLALGHQALAEVKERPYDTSEASIVFEDGWREVTPSQMQYLADYVHETRGLSQERGHLEYMVKWLEELPVEEAMTRAEYKIAKILSRAWKMKIVVPADEEDMPILRHLYSHIRYGILLTRKGTPLRFLRSEIAERSFRIYPRAPGGGKHPPSIDGLKRLARRVADVIYEEGKRVSS